MQGRRRGREEERRKYIRVDKRRCALIFKAA